MKIIMLPVCDPPAGGSWSFHCIYGLHKSKPYSSLLYLVILSGIVVYPARQSKTNSDYEIV